MSLLKKPIFWIGIVGLSAAAWVATSPEDTAKRAVVKPAKKTAKKKASIEFLREDFEAKFAPVKSDLKNVFQPIVAKTSGLRGGEGLANAIPADFAGGDSGWVYTGNAEVDGVQSALLESRTTGEGVFLKSGERWKSAVVTGIHENSVVMKGPSGTKTFALVDSDKPPMLAGNGFAPVRVVPSPEIRGAIGRQANRTGGQAANDPMPGTNFQPGAMLNVPNDVDPEPLIVAPPEVNQ
jgi:hypothetical protein